MKHEEFVLQVQEDTQFLDFLETVAPKRQGGQQQVFLPELWLVLQILWEIYHFFKNKNVVSKFMMNFRVKRLMANNILTSERVAALGAFATKYCGRITP